MQIDSSSDQSLHNGNTNNTHNYKTTNSKESNNDVAHLKTSVLSFIASHQEPAYGNGNARVSNECSAIVASVFDLHIQDLKTHYKQLIDSINTMISQHTFNRHSFLGALHTPSSVPPLLFLYYLHVDDIISFSDFLEALSVSKHDEFIQQIKEAFDPSNSDTAVFDNFITCLVDMAFEKSESSAASAILAKICDPKWSVRKMESLKRLLHVLKLVSKMRPAKIPKHFFSTRLIAFCSSDGPNSELSKFEDLVKKILNPPPIDKNREEDAMKDMLQKLFSEFRIILSVDEMIGVITKVALTLQGDWETLGKCIQYLILTVRDFGTHFADPLHGLAKDAVTNLNEDLLKVTLMFSWIVLPFNLYIDWFTANFCTTATSMLSSKNLRQLLARVMTALVGVESIELTKQHRSIIKKHPDLRAVMHDYLMVDRAAPASSVGKTASVDDAIVNVRSFLESFRQTGKLPEKLKTIQYFGPGWFKSTFLPTILSLEEEQKNANIPDFKDIHLFVKALQTQGVVTQTDTVTWKASQDEHTAKVRAALRLAKGRDTEKPGRRPIDPLRSMLREFVDRARVHNFQVGSSLAEIAARANDILSTHQDQSIPCVNLLMQAFCEVSVLMARTHKENNELSVESRGKGAGVQLTGDFVRRILMQPSMRAVTRERIRELVCVLALELDDVHITCLSLLLAHMAVTTEREGPTENASFANDIFRQLHANIRNISWMGFAAKFCSKFVNAIAVVSSYVIVPDSLDDSPINDDEPMTDSSYDYSLVPPLALKLLIWLKSRYSFGHQVVALCSSHTTLHHHTPTFVDFSATATLLLSTFLPTTYTQTLARQSGSFSLEEFVHAEIRVAACGDFLDGVWKVEYIRKMLRETYIATQPFSSFLESLVHAWFNVEQRDEVCACSKSECNGKPAVLAAMAEFVEGENLETIFGFFEKELEKSTKSQSAQEVTKLLSIGLQLLAHVHPLAFDLIAVKSLLYTFAKYLKFLVPSQTAPLPHMVTHPSGLFFVLLARVFGFLVRKQPELASTIKDLIGQTPYSFFFTMNLQLYKKTTAFVGVDEYLVSSIYSSLDSIHSWIQLLMQGQCNSTNLKEVVQTITSLPTTAAHVIFHASFTHSPPLSTSTQSLHDKASKIESLLSLLCGTLTNHTTLATISLDKTFEFLSNFTDILVFYLSTSPSYNLKQLHSPTSLPAPPASTQHATMEQMVESLLSVLLVRLPFLLAVLSHPSQFSFLTTGRSTLFPSFASSSTSSSRYPFIMYLILTAIPSATLWKILGGPAGTLWQGIILESYETSQKTAHPSYNMSGTFRETVEHWICGWIERCGVHGVVADKVLPSFDLSSPTIPTAIRHNTISPITKDEEGEREKVESKKSKS